MENAAPPVARPLSWWVKLLCLVVVLEAVGVVGLIGYLVVFGHPLLCLEAAVTPVTPGTPLPLLVVRAQIGDAAAQAELGWRHLRGTGGAPRDYHLAFVWLQRAALQGNPRGETAFGLMYSYGYGIPRDRATALDWYRKAAAQDYPAAEANLGVAYFHGTGVDQDYASALDWFRKGAAGNDAMAEDFLGAMYEHGQGVAADPAQALAWYRRSAEHGRRQGERNLGIAYLRGIGTPVDYTLALFWLQKAADRGDARAEYLVGTMYKLGQGVPVNRAGAEVWFARAQVAGYGPAAAETDSLTPMTLSSPALDFTLPKKTASPPSPASANDQTNAAPVAPAH